MTLKQSLAPTADISFHNAGMGFFTIAGETARGKRWVDKHVQGAEYGNAYCDDMRMAMNIAEGAVGDGLMVE